METELKFQVPEASRAALEKAVAAGAVRRTRLQAVYADTPDLRLSAAGLALRLRKEGRVWVQTLKGRGDGLMQRLEHEVPLPPQRGVPELDPQRHAGTAAGQALAAALAGGGPLQPVYRTDILRQHRVLRGAGGARIELAYDSGHIIAAGQRVPVCEIEFELKQGPLQALPLLAQRWVARHGLWWDVRTKSERGFRLAFGHEQVPAIKAQPVQMPPQATAAQAWQAMLLSALQQALPNAAELAGGTGQPEHLHQLRVALRRLRSVLRVFAGWGGDAAAAQALEAGLREPFALLGAARDADVLALLWRPQLEAAGAPPLQWTARQRAADRQPADPGAVVRGPAFSTALLQTLALAVAAPARPKVLRAESTEARRPSPQPQPALPGLTDASSAAALPAPAEAGSVGDDTATADGVARPLTRRAVLQALQPLHKRVRRGIARFDEADSDERHRLRKQLKRLRYALEGVGPLLQARKASGQQTRLHTALRQALEALGTCNDLDTAEAAFRAWAAEDPQAWFAAGWVAGLRSQALRRAGKALRRLRKHKL